MLNLSPYYRIKLNKNILKYPLFFEYLKQLFHKLVYHAVLQGNIDLSTEYKFIVKSIPNQWGKNVAQQLKLMQNVPEDKIPEKWKEIAKMLLDLDPFNPQQVEIKFTLNDILKFTVNNVKHYQEIVTGGVADYFGIETQLWFNDYPIQTGTVLRAVDFGTLEKAPLHLFDSVFMDLRTNLMNNFTFYINHVLKQESVVVKNNVDI